MLNPVPLAATVFERALQQHEGLLAQSRFNPHAGATDERAGVVGIQLQRPLQPFHRTNVLPVGKEPNRANRQGPDVGRVQRQHALSAAHTVLRGGTALVHAIEHLQRLPRRIGLWQSSRRTSLARRKSSAERSTSPAANAVRAK